MGGGGGASAWSSLPDGPSDSFCKAVQPGCDKKQQQPTQHESSRLPQGKQNPLPPPLPLPVDTSDLQTPPLHSTLHLGAKELVSVALEADSGLQGVVKNPVLGVGGDVRRTLS